jgi:uncharacterized protein (DUF58 family)
MRRGRELVEMSGVGSQYPFGFLHKYFGGRIAQEVHVWPARVPYEADLAALAAPDSVGEVLNRVGAGNDFVNLRHYRLGDPMRQVHWKATARLRRLVVREVLAENHSGFFLHIETPAVLWRRPEQFEKLCGFAATLAEDLFRQQQLIGVVINDRAPIRIRRMADLVLFLDQLAILQPVEHYRASGSIPSRNVIRFEPAAPDGVHALVRGQKAAAA